MIEIMIVIGLIAILAAIVIVAVNPARQFAQGRNVQRTANVGAILNAIGQNIVDNKGVFTCGTAALPPAQTDIKKTGGYDLRPCIVPTYISEIPLDPGAQNAVLYPAGTNTCNDASCSSGSYDTRYTVAQDSTNGRITVCAPFAADEVAIANATSTCITR